MPQYKRRVVVICAALTALALTGCPVNTGMAKQPIPKLPIPDEQPPEEDTVPDAYIVNFNINGGMGTAPSAIKTDAGESITLPDGERLSKVGFVFDGWNTLTNGTGSNYNAGDPYTPEGSITLYAKWQYAYTISFSPNGGSGTPPAAQTVKAGGSITLPYSNGMSKTGFTFSGWNTGFNGSGNAYASSTLYTPISSITLYAMWVPQNTYYTVSFNINNGSGPVPGPLTTNAGSFVFLPYGDDLSRNGYVFDGWNTQADGEGDNYRVAPPQLLTFSPVSDTVLYARWIAPYTTGNFVFREEAAACTLIGYNGGGGAVDIPATANGKPVTVIADSVFRNKNLTSVVIPNSVTEIGTYAFDSNQLTGVVIPDSVTTMGRDAFAFNQLTGVVIPNSVTEIGIEAFAFNQLKSVTIPNGIIFIDGMVFYDNQLESVVIPDSVKTIGVGAFDSNQLTSVTIGADVALDARYNSVTGGFDSFYKAGGSLAGTYTRPDVDSEWERK